jgi:hypothetical protein
MILEKRHYEWIFQKTGKQVGSRLQQLRGDTCASKCSRLPFTVDELIEMFCTVLTLLFTSPTSISLPLHLPSSITGTICGICPFVRQQLFFK